MWCQQVRKDKESSETKYTTEVFAGMNLLLWAMVAIATSLHQVVLKAGFCPLKSMWELETAVSLMFLLQYKLGDIFEAKQLIQTRNSPEQMNICFCLDSPSINSFKMAVGAIWTVENK